MAEKDGICAVRPKVAGCNQKALIFWVFRLGTILRNEKYEGCPNFLFWGFRHQVTSCTNSSSLQLGAEASS
jgi:hypothetical protein